MHDTYAVKEPNRYCYLFKDLSPTHLVSLRISFNVLEQVLTLQEFRHYIQMPLIFVSIYYLQNIGMSFYVCNS